MQDHTQNLVLHEVAVRPFQIDPEDWGNNSVNDDTYKRYVRLLRSYDCFAWYRQHTCWACNKNIDDYYQAHVYVARPAIFVHQLGREATFWVEKFHYPECPDRLREFEEEMYASWDKEDRARERSERKAA